MKEMFAVYNTNQFGVSFQTSKFWVRYSDASKHLNKLTSSMPYFQSINYAVRGIICDQQFHTPIVFPRVA